MQRKDQCLSPSFSIVRWTTLCVVVLVACSTIDAPPTPSVDPKGTGQLSAAEGSPRHPVEPIVDVTPGSTVAPRSSVSAEVVRGAVSVAVYYADYANFDGTDDGGFDIPEPDRPRFASGAAAFAGLTIDAMLAVPRSGDWPYEEMLREFCEWAEDVDTRFILSDLVWPIDPTCLPDGVTLVDMSGRLAQFDGVLAPSAPPVDDVVKVLTAGLVGGAVAVLTWDVPGSFDPLLWPAGARHFAVDLEDPHGSTRDVLNQLGQETENVVALIPPGLLVPSIREQRPKWTLHVVSAPFGGPALTWMSASSNPVTPPGSTKPLSDYWRPLLKGAGWLPSGDLGTGANPPNTAQAADCREEVVAQGARWTTEQQVTDTLYSYCEAMAFVADLLDQPVGSVFVAGASAGASVPMLPIIGDEACDCVRHA